MPKTLRKAVLKKDKKASPSPNQAPDDCADCPHCSQVRADALRSTLAVAKVERALEWHPQNAAGCIAAVCGLMYNSVHSGTKNNSATVSTHADLQEFRDGYGGAIAALGPMTTSSGPFHLAMLDVASAFLRASSKITAVSASGSNASLGLTGIGRALEYRKPTRWPDGSRVQFRVLAESGETCKGTMYVPPHEIAAAFYGLFGLRPSRVSDTCIVKFGCDNNGTPYTADEAVRAAEEFATVALRYTSQVIKQARSLLIEKTMMGRDAPLSDANAIRTSILQSVLASGLYRASGVMMVSAVFMLAAVARPEGPAHPRSGLPPSHHARLAAALRPALKEAKADFALVEKFFEGLIQREDLTLSDPDVSATHAMIVLQAYPVLYLADALVNERHERPPPGTSASRDRYAASEFLPLQGAYGMVTRAADYIIEYLRGAVSDELSDSAMWAPIDALSLMNLAAAGLEGLSMRRDELMGLSESEAASLLASVAALSDIPDHKSRANPYGRISQDFMALTTLPEIVLHVLDAGVLTPQRLLDLAPESVLGPCRRNLANSCAGRDAAGVTEDAQDSRECFDMLMMRLTADPGGREGLHRLLTREAEGSEPRLPDVIQSLQKGICLTRSGIFATLAAAQLSGRKSGGSAGAEPPVTNIRDGRGFINCAVKKEKGPPHESLRRSSTALTLEAAAQVLSDIAALTGPEDRAATAAWMALVEDLDALSDMASDTSDAASGEGAPVVGAVSVRGAGAKGATWGRGFRTHMTACVRSFVLAAPRGIEPFRAWLEAQLRAMDSLREAAPPVTRDRISRDLGPLAKAFGIEASLHGALELRPRIVGQLEGIEALRGRLRGMEARLEDHGPALGAPDAAAAAAVMELMEQLGLGETEGGGGRGTGQAGPGPGSEAEARAVRGSGAIWGNDAGLMGMIRDMRATSGQLAGSRSSSEAEEERRIREAMDELAELADAIELLEGDEGEESEGLPAGLAGLGPASLSILQLMLLMRRGL